MSASGIPPGGPNKPPDDQKGAKLPSSPQVKREAIPPSSSDVALDRRGAAAMAAGVSQDLKRKGKGILPSSPPAKRAATTAANTTITAKAAESVQEVGAGAGEAAAAAPDDARELVSLQAKIMTCFGKAPDSLANLNLVATFCFDAIKEKMRSGNYIEIDEIIKLYQLLFETELKAICREEVAKPLNVRDPNPAYVIYFLHDTTDRLKNYPSFEAADKARNQYLTDHSHLARFLELPLAVRKQALAAAPAADKAAFENMQNACPLYTVRDWFRGNNTNLGYVLMDKAHNLRWIFKPTIEKTGHPAFPRIEISANSPASQSQQEHLAYLVNFHKQFPIPAVFLAEIKGFLGSIQPLIAGTTSLQEAPSERLSIQDLQALLIYDLLFANCDRHEDNLLIQQVEDVFHVFGIDHDACMQFNGQPLKIEYLNIPHAFDIPFQHDVIAPLISRENIDQYERLIRQEHDEPDKAIEWMKYVAEYLRAPGHKELHAKIIANHLIQAFSSKHP